MPEEKRLRTKSELKKLFTNLQRKGITDDMIAILIDVLWRGKYYLRTSGFYWAGAPDMLMEWDNAIRTLTLTPREPDDPEADGAEDYHPHYKFFSWGGKPVYQRKYESENIELPDEEGIYVIFYTTNEITRSQELTFIKNPDIEDLAAIYIKKVIIACIYWDYNSQKAIYFGDERHGSEWIPSMHWWAHGAFNAIRDYGLRSSNITIGDGSQNAHAQVGISEGAAWHEDLWHKSGGIGSTEGLPIFYRTAIGPRFILRSGFPVTGPVNQRIYYNFGGSLTEADEGRFVLCHLFWTNCLLNPLIAVMGQAQYNDAVEAVANCTTEIENLDQWLPHQTKLHITSLIYETSNEFTNDVKARIAGEMTPESIADIVSKENIPALKTGWHPEVLNHIKYTYNEAEHSLILELLTDFTTYFVKGIKYKVRINIFFNGLPDALGMAYIDGDGDSWSASLERWDEWETEKVKAVALYRNSRLSQTPYLGWRMHNWEIEGRTRGNIIQETGLEHIDGLVLSINETNSHEIDISDGSLRLADIVAHIEHDSGNTFGQYLRSLRARRHYLKTYIDDSDPENPVITHEWEYQDIPVSNVANLSDSNKVVINELIEGSWQLTETTTGDYTAMWLIVTLDYSHPLKWITGTKFSSDLEEAKSLNNPESLLSVIDAAQFITDHYEVLARVIIKNIVDAPYYELIEIQDFEDGEFEKETEDRHVVDMEFDNNIRKLVLKRNAGLNDLEAEIPGGEQVQSDWNETDTVDPAFIKNKPEPLQGNPGADGEDGDSAYVYIAYASDNAGSGFTMTFDPALDYIAILSTDIEIISPQAADFSGLWKNYKGDDGDTGMPGTPGTPGADGEDGDSAYVYIAYASDNSGSNFTMTFDPALNYIAILSTNTEITSPQATDFAGLWKNYKGEKGEDGDNAACLWQEGSGWIAPKVISNEVRIGGISDIGNYILQVYGRSYFEGKIFVINSNLNFQGNRIQIYRADSIPANPPNGFGVLYVNPSDNHVYFKNNTETWDLTETGDTDSLWTDDGSFLYPSGNERISIGKSSNSGKQLEVEGSAIIKNNLYLNSVNNYIKYESLQGIIIQPSGTSNKLIIYQDTGNIEGNGTFTGSNFILNSSRKLKKNIKKIENLKKFDKIQIVQFQFKNNDQHRVRYGVIAEDIENIAPELIYKGKNKTVAYIDLLAAKIARLEQRIDELTEKLECR